MSSEGTRVDEIIGKNNYPGFILIKEKKMRERERESERERERERERDCMIYFLKSNKIQNIFIHNI